MLNILMFKDNLLFGCIKKELILKQVLCSG